MRCLPDGKSVKNIVQVLFNYRLFFSSLNLQEQFDFGGVYVGSTKSIPFLLQNEGQACTKVLFDFLKYKDFKLDSNKDDKTGIGFCCINFH